MAEKDWRKEKFKSDFPGVYFRKHPTRKHGVQPDKYFFLRYKLNGKELEEGLGWASKGHTAREASDILGELKRNRTRGEGPITLREKRELEEAVRSEERSRKGRNRTPRVTIFVNLGNLSGANQSGRQKIPGA